MPHLNKKIKHIDGRVWHLEGTKMEKSHAEMLARHVRNGGSGHARIIHTENGYEVWSNGQ